MARPAHPRSLPALSMPAHLPTPVWPVKTQKHVPWKEALIGHSPSSSPWGPAEVRMSREAHFISTPSLSHFPSPFPHQQHGAAPSPFTHCYDLARLRAASALLGKAGPCQLQAVPPLAQAFLGSAFYCSRMPGHPLVNPSLLSKHPSLLPCKGRKQQGCEYHQL